MSKPILSIVVVSIILSCSPVGQKQNSKPNIVFILADDMGYGDPGCYNADSKIPTPNIDRLAAEGVLFTDAHAPGAWCSPSRYGLVTGTYPGNTPMNTRERSLIEPGRKTIANLMANNGYRTACVGKWHLGFDGVDWEQPGELDVMRGGPVDKGFHYFFGMHASLDIPPYFYIENDRVVQAPTGYIDAHISPGATSPVSGAFYRAGAISPDFNHEEVLEKFRDKAFAFLNDHRQKNSKQPFFLYLPFTSPHTPWLPKEEYRGKSSAGEYGDFVVQVDDLVGQVVHYLQQNDLRENTVIFFSSDNGPVWFEADVMKYGHESVGPLRGIKGDMWEGGSRMPFIASGPGIAAGMESDQMVCFTDMMATLADMVGDTTLDTSGLDSYSFLSALRNKPDDTRMRDELIIADQVYRSDHWKFIDGWGQGGITLRYSPDREEIEIQDIPGELYNLEEDLSEQNNLYGTDPDMVAKMRARLENILAD